MKHLYKAILYSLLLITLFSSCTETEQKEKTGKLRIVTTTGMIKDAVQNITGNAAEVTALMGPGVDPHLYKATKGDLDKLSEADVIFYNGLHLEGKMTEILERLAKKKPVFAVTETIPSDRLRKLGENTYDPHIWFDVNLWKEAVTTITGKLKALDTQQAQVYEQNRINYSRELDSLHTWVKAGISSIPPSQRILITAHDAFGYFGDAYAIQVEGLQGISTVSEFGLSDISQLVNLIVQNNIKAVFVESSVPKKSIEAVVRGAKERGHEVKIGGTLYSDAMGEEGTPEGTYTGMVKSNVTTIVEGLK